MFQRTRRSQKAAFRTSHDAFFFPLSEATGKQYNQQNKLGQIVNALKANKLELLSALPDVDLRNAINHGGINIKGGKNGSCRVDIAFTRDNRRQFKTFPLYSLTSQTLDLASGIKGALFGLLAVFERVGAEKWVDEIGDAYEKGLLIGLSAGSPPLDALMSLPRNWTTKSIAYSRQASRKRTQS